MVETNVEKILANRDVPMATNSMAKSVSQYRRQKLEEEVNRGHFRDKVGTGSHIMGDGSTEAGNITASIKKTATTASSGWGGSSDTTIQIPQVYSPLWLTSNINFPRDRATINAWCRAYNALNPYVANAISLHSTYPISKLNITCKDSKIQQFFEEQVEELDLINVCAQIAQEYFVLGEAFPYAELNEGNAKWNRIILQNPDYVVVKHSAIAGEPILSLRPDQHLKNLVTSNKPSDVQQRQRIDKSIIEHVKRGENIPLSNFHASHIARKLNPYETRGTGLIVSCFKTLMLMDKIREAKYVQADSMINPLTLVKVGGAEGFRPTSEDLEKYKEIFEQGQFNPDFKIFTHGDVAVEKIGSGQGILDTTNDFDRLTKELFIGLLIPQVLMDGGGDVTYANGGVTLDVLKQRYLQFRNILSSWLRRRIFAPISKMNDFYEKKDGKKVLVIPDIEWNHMSLFDAGDYINFLMTLVSAQGEGPPKVPMQTVYRSLGLDWEEETRKLKIEAIQNHIYEKELAVMKQMSLTELRTLDIDNVIEEKADSPVPGESNDEEGGNSGEELPSLPGMTAPPEIPSPEVPPEAP